MSRFAMKSFLLFLLTSLSYGYDDGADYDDIKPKKSYMRPVIGIDLGTTYTAVGVFKDGKVVILPNEQGKRITPSVVAFARNGERLIGDTAKSQLSTNPENTVYEVKRLIGRNFNDSTVKEDIKHWPFKVFDSQKRPVIAVLVGKEQRQWKFAPEEISAMILMKMKDYAESFLGEPVKSALITVPASFTDAQRQATKDAGRIAGLGVVRIINEPTAAAVAFGMLDRKAATRNVVVFNLGGGTIDVTLLLIEDNVFHIQATNGDNHLGGANFDATLSDYYKKKIEGRYPGKILSKNAAQKLLREVERAKRILSDESQTRIELDSLFDQQNETYSDILTRKQFEELNTDLFRRVMLPLKKVLADANITAADVNEIVLVGGTSRMPKIRRMVTQFFNGKEPAVAKVEPEEAVAYGATLCAEMITTDAATVDALLLDVSSFSLGIETVGGNMTTLIGRYNQIPTSKTKHFTTAEDQQKSVTIKVYEGEHSQTKHNRLLGMFDLNGIQPAQKGTQDIDVTFAIDVNGILEVTAANEFAGKQRVVIANDHNRLSHENVERMSKNAEIWAEEDRKEKKLREAREALELRLYRLKADINDPNKLGNVLLETSKLRLASEIDKVIWWLDVNKNESIDPKTLRRQKLKIEEFLELAISKASVKRNDEL